MTLILQVTGTVLFLLAGLNVGHPKVQLGWLGAALWGLSIVLGTR